jgi:hypothetical protein
MTSIYLNIILYQLILLLILLIIVYFNKNKNKKNIYYYQNTYFNLGKTFENVFLKYSIIKTDDKDKATLYLPFTYNNVIMEIKMMPIYSDKYYFVLAMTHLFVGKDNLWLLIKEYYKDLALEVSPQSYCITVEMELFKTNFDSTKKYILKKNTQAQDNIIISSSYDKIIDLASDATKKYVIIQELLQDPYLIGKRKINLRVYLLIINRKGKLELYIYKDGFLYYTPDFYVPNSDNNDHNITTGYIDRSVYETNPLTHQNLKVYMGAFRYSILFNNIEILITKVMKVFYIALELGQSCKDSVMFELFGCDIAVNADLSVKIMEINKGPDLNPKSSLDGDLKFKLVENMFELTGLITRKSTKEPNLFMKLKNL